MADQVQVQPGEVKALQVEINGLNVIDDADRKGKPSQLFWPWFGANVSVLGLSYGAFALGFGISFWQAVIAGVVGIVFSFLLCGLIALAGKRGSAPTHGAQPGRVRRTGQQAAVAHLLAADRRLGDRADHPRHARDRDRVRAARLGRRRGHQGDRAGRRRHPDRRRRRARVRPDHADADDHHGRHRRTDRRLHHPGRGPGQLEQGQRPAERLDPGRDRRARLPDDRLRPRLGERRGRLLALPPALRVQLAA